MINQTKTSLSESRFTYLVEWKVEKLKVPEIWTIFRSFLGNIRWYTAIAHLHSEFKLQYRAIKWSQWNVSSLFPIREATISADGFTLCFSVKNNLHWSHILHCTYILGDFLIFSIRDAGRKKCIGQHSENMTFSMNNMTNAQASMCESTDPGFENLTPHQTDICIHLLIWMTGDTSIYYLLFTLQ